MNTWMRQQRWTSQATAQLQHVTDDDMMMDGWMDGWINIYSYITERYALVEMLMLCIIYSNLMI